MSKKVETKPVLYWSVDESNIYLDDDAINDGRLVYIRFTDTYRENYENTKERKLQILTSMIYSLKSSITPSDGTNTKKEVL